MALAVRRLQSVIVDALENVKAQDILVFDTEHLSALFERVIVASGTSNRQTRALAASVRDAVKGAGEPHPRTEGEQNGEWIIVDCGPAVVHVMQPAIRAYYHLEELWGEKPLKATAAAKKAAGAALSKAGARSEAVPAKRASKAPVVSRSGAGAPSLRRRSPSRAPEREIAPERPTVGRTARPAAGDVPAASPARKAPVARKSTGASVRPASSAAKSATSTSSKTGGQGSKPAARSAVKRSSGPVSEAAKPVARPAATRPARSGETAVKAARSASKTSAPRSAAKKSAGPGSRSR